MTTSEQQTPVTAIDPATQVGLVALRVADLNRAIAFYTEGFGFALVYRAGPLAVLGVAGAPVLLLTEHAGARPWPPHATGLYHFAVLVPSREDLGRWLRHWLERGNRMPGQGDHLVSEALYLSDPDGNGIEIYRDRARDEWQWAHGQVQMATGPVDTRSMLAEAERQGLPWTGLSAGTRIGHIHLQVRDIAESAAFYHGALGFDIMAELPQALFVSAGGYHHHIGLNTWQSRGAAPAPAGTAGLRFFTLDLPSEAARAAVVARLAAADIAFEEASGSVVVRDPSRNTMLLHIGRVADAEAAAALATVLP